MKKITFILAVLLCVLFAPIGAKALTQSEAVAWARAQESRTGNCDVDGNGLWCTDLATAYINYCWLRTNNDGRDPWGTYPYTTRMAYAYDDYLRSNVNWNVISRTSSTVPQPGDLFVCEQDSAGYGYGHVGVVLTAYGSTRAEIIEMSEGTRPKIKTVTWGSTASYNPQYFIRFVYFTSSFELDVNGWTDNDANGNVSGYATFDMYINGSRVADDVSDFCQAVTAGSTYEIKDIKVANGKAFDGLSSRTRSGFVSGDRTGTVNSNTDVRLAFHTIDAASYAKNHSASNISVYNGHSYYYYNSAMTWYDAKKISEYLGGHLVTISSAAENSFIKGVIGSSACWLGATDAASEGTWQWVSGESFSYNNWNSGEPNNSYGNYEGAENYAHIFQDGSTWNDGPGYMQYTFVCEIDRAYTVSYNLNGGSGSFSSQNKAVGQTIKLSSSSPTKTGYTFQGWATSGSATSAEYQPGGSYTNDQNVTLYAVWRANSYTVTYNANGGYVSSASKSVTYDSTYGTLDTPYCTGYTFAGWFTAASGGSQITSSTKVTTASNHTIYAHWTANPYTVAYDANGGTGAPSSQTKYHGTALTLSSTQPTFTGYTFQGWATSASATSPEYQPGGSYTQNQAVTLYAVWKLNTYRFDVNFNINGQWVDGNNDAASFTLIINGVNKGDNLADFCDNEIPYGSSYSITNIKAKPGYRYMGFSEDYSPLSGTVNQKIDVRLIYVSEYTVTYDQNTTDAVGNMPENQKKIRGEELTLSSNKPTRKGYTFICWSLRPDAYSGNLNPGGVYSADEDVILYAMWEKNGTAMPAGAGRSLLNGDYFICSALDESYALDIEGTAVPAPEGSNVQLFGIGRNVYDAWTLTYLNNGFYSIKQYDTQMALTVAGNSTEWRANIQANTYTGSKGQQWSIERTDFGYRFKARCSGFSVDITGGMDYVANFTNIQQYKDNLGDKAGNQSWIFVPYQPAQGLVPDFVLPSALKTIEAEAFAGSAFQYAYLPEGTEAIRSKAFAGCPNLAYIYIPEECVYIAQDAFDSVTGLTIFGKDGSYAEFYAGKHGFTFIAK